MSLVSLERKKTHVAELTASARSVESRRNVKDQQSEESSFKQGSQVYSIRVYIGLDSS